MTAFHELRKNFKGVITEVIRIFLLAILIFFLVHLLIKFYIMITEFYNEEQIVILNEHSFRVEIADSSEERAVGLMNRERLEQNEGMLFIYEEEGYYPFWMRNMVIPLDIIWIDRGFRVVYIEENAKPCLINVCFSYTSDKKALYVLEVIAGTVERTGLKIEDRVIIGND